MRKEGRMIKVTVSTLTAKYHKSKATKILIYRQDGLSPLCLLKLFYQTRLVLNRFLKWGLLIRVASIMLSRLEYTSSLLSQ